MSLQRFKVIPDDLIIIIVDSFRSFSFLEPVDINTTVLSRTATSQLVEKPGPEVPAEQTGTLGTGTAWPACSLVTTCTERARPGQEPGEKAGI